MAGKSINEITIREETLRKIRSMKDLNSSEECVILDLIEHAKSCDGWWEDRFE